MRRNLALLLQEPLAGITKIRCASLNDGKPNGGESPEITDAVAFRDNFVATLRHAEEHARLVAYSSMDIKSAIFAVVAMLDETVLDCQMSLSAEWRKQPLCLELFKTNRGGEVFFKNVTELLQRGDSPDTADVLEVYLLCLLLGFAGIYKDSEHAEIQVLKHQIREKILHTRGGEARFPQEWQLPSDVIPLQEDVLAKRLKITAAAAVALTLIVFSLAKWDIVSGSIKVQTLAETRHGSYP